MHDPDPEEMRRIGYRAVDRAVEHLANLRDQRVITPPDAAVFDELVAEPLPLEGLGIDSGIDRVFDDLMPRATLVNHPRFFGYVPGPGSFVGAVGEWIAAASNAFVGTWLGGAVMARVEIETVDWLRQMLGLDAEWRGLLTSGGSMANLGALAAARSRVDGDPHRLTVFVSSEAHYSLAKAARILGVPEARIVEVPVDAEQRMDVDALAAAMRKRDGAQVVVTTMGTTSTGAVDPIERIEPLCRDHDAWLHVDGAWGGAFAVIPERSELRQLLGMADSIAIDPHKGLYCPFESGCLLTRKIGDLRAAFTADGAYMQDVPRDAVNFFELGPELTRGNRALKLWLLIRSVGADAIADAVREDVRLCRRAHDRIAQDPRIVIVTPPRLSVFSFTTALGANEARALVRRIHEDGFAMLSSTLVDGRFAIRFCVANHRTTDADIDETVDRVLSLLAT